MGKKRMLIPVLLFVLAAVLLALLPREGKMPSGLPSQTRTEGQSQTLTTAPAQTRPPEETGTEPTPTTEPEQTGSKQTEPTETKQTESTETVPKETVPETTGSPVPTEPLFPVELEGGLLMVRSLFQFSGMNPDADNAFGEDIAGVELTNNSDSHMTAAEVTAVMSDGTVLTFRAEDVPAGRTVMAFCVEPTSIRDVSGCGEIYGYAEFDDSDLLRSDLVVCTVDGIAITVRNVSGTELSDLSVICHGLLDGSLFGGSTYCYNVSTLPAGASTVIYAADCILGMAEVVRVASGS